MRTLLAGMADGACSGVVEGMAADTSGEMDGEGDCSVVGDAIGVCDSCAEAIWTKAIETTKVTMRSLSIEMPVHVRKSIVPPFAVAQKFFIEIICDKLIVQTVEASKVIDRALSRVFACSPGFHEKCPIT